MSALIISSFQPSPAGWILLSAVVLIGAGSAIAFVKLMFSEPGEDDRRFLRTAWWMLAGWLITLCGAAVYYFFFLDV